jgi:Tat protein translocase TatB subunit
MLNIGTPELFVIIVIALLVVGPERLPALARQIGRGLREFRKMQDDVKDMVKLDLDDDTSTKPTAPVGSPMAPGVHRTRRPVSTNGDGPASVADHADGPTAAD